MICIIVSENFSYMTLFIFFPASRGTKIISSWLILTNPPESHSLCIWGKNSFGFTFNSLLIFHNTYAVGEYRAFSRWPREVLYNPHLWANSFWDSPALTLNFLILLPISLENSFLENSRFVLALIVTFSFQHLFSSIFLFGKHRV